MRSFLKIASSRQLKTRNLSIGRNYLEEIPADKMANAVVRLEKVSLVDGDLTDVQVETIFDKMLSKNPDELLLRELDIREFREFRVSPDVLERVKKIMTLKTGMSYNNYDYHAMTYSLSDSDSDSGDSDPAGMMD